MVANIGVDTAKNDLSKIHQKVDHAGGKKEESTHSVGSGCPEHLEGESAEVRKPERQERQPTGLGLQLFRDEEHVDPGSSAAWDKVAPAARP